MRYSGIAATVQTDLKWWANATTSPWVGPINNWSIGYPESIETYDLFAAIEAEGMVISCYRDHPEFAIIDIESHEEVPGDVCVLPE